MDISFTKIVRLGREGDKRPIKVVLDDPDSVTNVFNNAARLKRCHEDMHPSVCKELARLREVVKREKLKPENTGKDIYMN